LRCLRDAHENFIRIAVGNVVGKNRHRRRTLDERPGADVAVLAATLRSRAARLDEIGLCLGRMSQKVVQMTFTPRNPTPNVPNEASWTLCRLRLSFGGVMHLSE
jgi:hypothetical protein